MDIKGNILTTSTTVEAGYVASAGSANAYTVTLPGSVVYTAGLKVVFKANFTNTGAATINVNGLGAKTIVKDVASDLTNADIKNNQIVTVIYDGTNFQLQGTGTGGGGSAGSSGSDGSAGSSGTSGNNGANGSSGSSGQTGNAGSSGSSGSSGNTGSSGSSGTSGNTGNAGSSGTSGNSGTAGSSGAAGTSKPASITLVSPTTGDVIDLFYTSQALTVSLVADSIRGGGSVTYNVRWASAANSGSPTSLFSANRTVNSAAGSTTNTFASSSIPANSYVWLEVTAASGTINSCGISIIF